MHAWTLTSGKNVFSAHIGTDKPESVVTLLAQSHRVLRDQFGFYFSTLQVETVYLDEDHAPELDISALLRMPPSS